MVFSLFRKSDKASARTSRDAAKSDADNNLQPSTRMRTIRSSVGSAAREAARLTTEKIDQIENEMITDDHVIPMAPEHLEQEASSAPIKVVDTAEDVERALAKLREKTQAARAERLTSFDTQAETLAVSLAEWSGETRMPAGDHENTSVKESQVNLDAFGHSDFGLDSEAGVLTSIADNELLIGPFDGLAMNTEGLPLPGVIEEAAILFSNGEVESAKGALDEAIEKNAQPSFRMMAWYMLFDLHRINGDREAFDRLAIAYASDMERSPPAWNNDLVLPKKRAANPNASPSHGVTGETLAEDARKIVDQLVRAAGHKRDCSIDFTALKTLEQTGAEQMVRLIAEFAASGHPLKIYQLDALLTAAKEQTETGRRDESEAFWRLAMNCLQLKQLQSEFDDLSIDYCVTFEVSPPPWEPIRGSFNLQEDCTVSTDSSFDMSTIQADPLETAAVAANELLLSGDLCGKIDEQRTAIRVLSGKHKIISVDCRKLRRIDFVAAGELLNEQMALQNSSKVLRFIAPNYMVYALMRVMGIHELAQIKGPRGL